MTDFILDCSTAMAWCFEDENEPNAFSALRRLQNHSAYVPFLWFLEIANVLAVAEKRERIKKAESVRFLELLQSLSIVEETPPNSWERLTRILELARSHRITAYDATYIDLAMRLGLPIATCDKKLRTAAEQAEIAIVG